MLIHHPELPATIQAEHAPPAGLGGCFWALADAHDLPHGPQACGDAATMLRFGRLFWQDATAPGTWVEIQDVATVRAIRDRAIATQIDRINAADSGHAMTGATGFMPEFFFTPRGFRGVRMVRRAIERARCRFWRR